VSVPVVNSSWQRQNLARAYPFADWAGRADRSGSFRIPDDLLTSLYFPVGPELSVDPGAFHLKALSVYANGVGFHLGYESGGVSTLAAVATVARAGFAPFRQAVLSGVGEFAGSTGTLVVGSLDGLAAAPAGRFEFDPDQSRLDVDAIRPQLAGVSAIRVAGADGAETSLQGVVSLRFGANVRFSAQPDGSLRVDAIEGEGLRASCDCAESSEAPLAPIASINGVPAAAGGSAFEIVGDPCLTVSAAGPTLSLRDECSAPCCGCAEQERLRAEVDRILEQARTLDDFQRRLDSRVQAFVTNVVASKVNDAGCVECG